MATFLYNKKGVAHYPMNEYKHRVQTYFAFRYCDIAMNEEQ